MARHLHLRDLGLELFGAIVDYSSCWSLIRPDMRSTTRIPSRRRPELGDPTPKHDPNPVRDAKYGTANCSTTRIVDAFLRQLRDDLVELLDDERREAHRQLVEQQQCGVVVNARDMASICCSPPDNVPASGGGVRRGAESARSDLSSISFSDDPLCVAIHRFSRTERFGKIPLPSGIRHTPRRANSSGARR